MSSESDKTRWKDPGAESSQTNLNSPVNESSFAFKSDQWELLERLGEGGMSVVYKVRHRVMGKLAAAKFLHTHLVYQGKNLQRFQQESIAAGSISHENVINVLDCGITEDSQPYMIMDFIQGDSLADLLKVEHKLEPKRAVAIFKQIGLGVQAAHNQGIIHRDLKPSNVMLLSTTQRQDFVKIVDFGIAKVLVDDGDEIKAKRHQLTQTGEVFGSPLYMSPEQCGGQVPDARSDVYSIGCLMYECLAGVPPLMGANYVETLFKQINDTPPSIADARTSTLVKRLEQVIFKAMAKEPSDRYQNISQLLMDLDLASSGSIPWLMRGRAPRDLPGIWKKTNQRKITFATTLGLVAVVGAAAIIAASVLWVLGSQSYNAAAQTSQDWWTLHVPSMKASDQAYIDGLANNAKKVKTARAFFEEPNPPVGSDFDLATALYDKACKQYNAGEYEATARTIDEASKPLGQIADDDTKTAQVLREKFRLLQNATKYLEDPTSLQAAKICSEQLNHDIQNRGRKSGYFDTWIQATGLVADHETREISLAEDRFDSIEKMYDSMIDACDPTRDAEFLAKCYDGKALLHHNHEPLRDGLDRRLANALALFDHALIEAHQISGKRGRAITNRISIDLANALAKTDPVKSITIKCRVMLSNNNN
jgi:serine/threonine protein kinase